MGEVEKFDRMKHRDRCAARDLRDGRDELCRLASWIRRLSSLRRHQLLPIVEPVPEKLLDFFNSGMLLRVRSMR